MPVPIGKILIDPNADAKEELSKSAEQANEKAMKMLPEPIMEKRRLYGWIITSIAMIGVVFSVIKVMLGLKEKYRINIGGSAKRVFQRKDVIAWTLMFPALITVLLWQYIPLIWGSIMAFFDYKLLGGGKYIGIDNFITAFFDPMFYYVILITIYYVLLSIAIGFTAPIALAWFLSEVPRGKILYRTIFYLPTVTTGLVIMFLWKDLFFNPTSQGLLNKIIALLGISHQTWLEDPRLAMLCIILPGVWAGTGSACILYLAALKTVPDELYESADIDGASTWQKIWSITIPTLKPLIIITFVGSFVGAFHAMQNIFVMTGGGPMNATRTIGMEIWINAFLFLKFGYATAMAWILGATLIGFTVYQLQILKKNRIYHSISRGGD
jgi:multiple sugar transport system permease protein